MSQKQLSPVGAPKLQTGHETKYAGRRHFNCKNSNQHRQFQSEPICITDVEAEFRAAAELRDLILPANLKTGCLYRCDVATKPKGNKAGAYLLHLDYKTRGGFQNHTDGLGWEHWRPSGIGADSPLNDVEHRQHVASARAEKHEESRRRQELTAKRARRIWDSADPPDPCHGYLLAKRILPYVARQINGSLVLPLRDADGRLWSLQFIRPDGTKRFLKRGRKGGLYCAIGRPDGVICIAEGFATAATIHEATGHAVAVAFDCGSLLAVGKTLRRKFPDIELRFCADDDAGTRGNPGLTKAIEAARSVGGTVTVPETQLVAP